MFSRRRAWLSPDTATLTPILLPLVGGFLAPALVDYRRREWRARRDVRGQPGMASRYHAPVGRA